MTNISGGISNTLNARAPKQTSSERAKASRKRWSLHSVRYHFRVRPSGSRVADHWVASE